MTAMEQFMKEQQQPDRETPTPELFCNPDD
jgi:hypothetical protein